ncbi:MAG TPA: PAS domain S-box protein [Chthoniobacterales bacterium]|nr:PAS domain S-box protein [Chthoniobacterales bacterium]
MKVSQVISGETQRTFWRSVAVFLLGCIVIALVTFFCFRFHASLAIVSLLYLVAVVLISLRGRFVLALLSSVLALLCLDYFFVPPIFAFSVIQPEDIVALFTFLTTALVTTTLVSRMRTSQQQWRDVFENNPTMYFIVDASGIVTSVNPYGAEQLGYSVSELVGQPVLNVFYEPDRPVVQKTFAKCVEQPGKSMSWEFRKVRKDGSVIWVRETAKAVKRASGPIALIACEDITAIKRSQQELEQAFQEIQTLRDQSRLIIDTIPDMIWTALPDGSVDFVNQRWVEYTGLSLEDGLEEAQRRGLPSSRHPDSLLHPEDLAKLEEWRASSRDRLRTGEPFEAELRFRRADGEYRWVMNRAVPLRDKQGKIVKWYGISVDIEDQKRAEEALQKAQAELAHVTRVTTLGELAASIAHEVNQPLGAISNNVNACLRFLATGSDSLQEVEGALSDIIKAVDRTNSIIVRMRALAKKVSPEMTQLHLEEVVTDVLGLIHHELTRRQITIHTELPKDLPPVLGDRVLLQQVLLNLVMNGLEAINEVADGERKISIRGRRHEHEGRPAVLVSVQDSGVGLKPAEVDRLFEAFYTTKEHGIGMGLAISRSIIEAHSGRLWVAPTSGPGATFEFILRAQS